jgi:hypothetical protein
MMKKGLTINVIAYQEGDVWIAQGVELDISARAKTPDAVPEAFSKAVAKTLMVSIGLDEKPFAGIGRAPKRFQDMFDKALARLVPIAPLQFGDNATNVDIRLAAAA